MFVRVVEARHLGGHRVWLRFDDGLEGEADLAGELTGEVFEPLADPASFGAFSLGEAPTLTWPNGADLAPDFLHELVRRGPVRRGDGSLPDELLRPGPAAV